MNFKKENLLKEAYSKLLDVGFGDGPLETINQFIDDDVMGYGTAQDEKIMSIREFRDLMIDQRKQAVNFDHFSFTSKPVINRISDNGNTAVIVDEILLLTRIKGEANELAVRMSTVFEFRDEAWKLIHWHGSKPEHISGGDDPWHVDEWKRKNEELQKLVDEKTSELLNKNRELEIETALEKVRAVAMGMMDPADMLDVCKTISNQLQSLGVKEIRNVQTAIFYERRGTYMNYQFYSKHDKTFITETIYTDSETHNEFARKMLKGKGETSIIQVKGAEVKDYIAYQRTTNVFIDKYLETASSLNYYWFSLGPVALGISTYVPLSEDEINLFKRFLKVFELAYQRFQDIEKAIAQAKEAMIEASLERVRAVAMSMNKPDDLLSICEVSFKEFQKLGFNNLRNAIIHIPNDQQKYFMDYDFSEFTGEAITKIEYGSHPIVDDYLEKIRSARDAYFEVVIEKDQLDGWKDFRKKSGQKDDPRLDEATAIYYYVFSIGVGDIGISTFKPIEGSQKKILKRFRNVFDLAYRRYNDIALAEVQAREAQIELALERVRARTMGMQKSEELKEVIRVVYEQFVNLKINVDHAGFVVDYKPKGDWHFWIADEQDIPSKITHPYFESVWANQFNEAKENGADFFATNLDFEEKNKFYNELLSYVPWLPEASKEYYLNCPGLAIFTVLLENVGLYIENFSGIPYTDEENATLMRFGKVFQQTYTRFLDLQKAETQAREAQIETALEKVRGRAMAMRSSEDLAATVNVFFKELKNLGFLPRRCGVAIIDEARRSAYNMITTADKIGDSFEITGDVNLDSHFVLTNMLLNWKVQKDYFPELDAEQMEEYYRILRPQVAVTNFNDARQYGYYLYFKEGMFYVWMDKELQVNDLQIFRRFTQVIDLTYRRHLDLQKAEAQARESQIEVSLERVRSKAMAMHSPDDLSETVNVFFKELKTLGIIPIRCGVGQIDEANRTTSLTTTTSSQQGESFQVIGKVKQTGHPVLDGIFDHWKLQQEYHPVLEGEDIKAYYDVMNAQIGYPDYPRGVTQYGNNFFFREGFVFAWTESKLSEEELQIFRRFTSVHSLTYRRYMDLKEAEAQAREAKIEVALERVRSRTMAMQKSDELAETVSVLFKQLLDLGIKSTQLRTCGIVTFKENEPKGEVWITDITGEIINDSFYAPYDEAPAYQMIYSKWKAGEKFLEINLQGHDFLEHLTYVKKYSAVPNINLDEIKKSYSEIFFHVLFFSQGYLFIISYEPLPEYHDIFKRFGALFQQTYTRFLDFKKVELQNKIIQADNERKTKELEDARQLQLSMLPKELPKLPHLDIAVFMKTATEVGGDYYDFNIDSNGTLTFIMGDATGHGMMSGMMVSIMKSFFIADRNNIELKKFFENANNSIKDMQLGRLMMALMGVQITSEKIIATNAGMPSLLYFRNKSQKAGEFVSHNLPLGGMKNTNYTLKEIRYEKGDTLLLMSDGFAELKNEKLEQYGYERVKEEFRSVAQINPSEIVEHLKTSASNWINDVEPDDDVTFVVIKVK